MCLNVETIHTYIRETFAATLQYLDFFGYELFDSVNIIYMTQTSRHLPYSILCRFSYAAQQ